MPLLDLVTPWAAARSASNPGEAEQRFADRNAKTLSRLYAQRTPHLARLPLAEIGPGLQRMAAHAGDDTFVQALREAEQRGAALGADLPHLTVLVAGAGEGETALPLPDAPPLVALFLDREADNTALLVAKLRAQALLTRWGAPDSQAALHVHRHPHWDRWTLMREVPLGEWIYGVGVALHLAQAVLPELEPHRLLGLRRGELGRLRERERALQALLAPELEVAAIGLVLRWLTPDTTASMRTVGDTVIPPGAGLYLAWRLTAERVARVGLREALRLSA
jgi:hypothetical protein